jgi:hypothetical protein
MATPYVISSDLVSAYPAKSLEIAQYIDGFKADLALVQNAQTGTTYSFVAADFTKLVTLSNASPVAVELPLEATVPWSTGTQLRLLNQGAGTVTVAGAVGVTINGTPLTLGQYKGANLIKTGTNTWTFIPFASGVGAAVYSDANTGTYTGFAYKTYTASGTLTVTTAGFADVVILAGGGAGGLVVDPNNSRGGGGAGGLYGLGVSTVYLPVGTHTVTVGAGGAVSGADAGIGNFSQLASFVAFGGGGSASQALASATQIGACGGGAANPNGIAGGFISAQGFAGGSATAYAPPYTNYGAGGGGGLSAAGGNGTTSVGGVGGAGTSTTIAGTTPSSSYVAGSYAFGGGGGGQRYDGSSGAGGSGGGGAASNSGAGTAGSANTGGGGGAGETNAGAGGSGLVIVKVAV